MNFFDADRLAGEDLAEIDFFLRPKQILPHRVAGMVLSWKG